MKLRNSGIGCIALTSILTIYVVAYYSCVTRLYFFEVIPVYCGSRKSDLFFPGRDGRKKIERFLAIFFLPIHALDRCSRREYWESAPVANRSYDSQIDYGDIVEWQQMKERRRRRSLESSSDSNVERPLRFGEPQMMP